MADYYLNKTAARIDFLLEKVEGIEDGAEVNQNAISSVTANGVTIASGSKTDSIEIVAGSNVTVVADASNKILTISADDTTYSDVTTSASGLMSAADKTKINGIEDGAEVNVQSDWNQTDTTADDFIKNKPEINGETLQGDKSSTELKIAGKIVDGGTGEIFNDYSNNVASGTCSHAEGYSTTARGGYAHAEGYYTTASASNAHAEGYSATASGISSHAEGYRTFASASDSHAEGNATRASANYSHAEGYNTKALSAAQHVQGKYNIEDSDEKYAFIIGNGTADNARSNALAVDWNGDIYPADYGKGVNLAQLDTDVAALRLALDAEVYGFKIDKQDSNPETRVTYLYDAVGKTPARMDFTTGQFNYGGWAYAWFIKDNKPCALKYDGTVDYYLDENDYTKKADGTASDISDATYAGNFMATMPTVWIKRWEDARYQYVAIANKQIDDDFKAYAHDAGDGYINDYIYYPLFKGVIVDGKLRSIAGVTPGDTTSASQEKAAAEACGTGWQLWDWAKHELISDLLALISRSTDSQASFGQGASSTYDATEIPNRGKLVVGTSGAGQFYGTDDETHHVKVFHIEDFWGNRWDRCLGLNLIDGKYAYKLVRPYALSPDSSYVAEISVSASGWQIEQYVGEFGALPKTTGGSDSTYSCDYFWVSSGEKLALLGGSCNTASRCGAFCLNLNDAASSSNWAIGSSPIYSAVHSS